MILILFEGVVLGLSAGISPGPLLTVVISQTLRHGVKEGIRVAMAPLITDLPIVILATFVLSRLTNFRPLLGSISLVGGLFLLYLTYGSFQTRQLDGGVQDGKPQSLSKGIVVNALSPHPYLFWISVGAPIVIKAWAESPIAAILFVVVLYACLVGSKVVLAILVGKSRPLLLGRAYGHIMRVLGFLLLIFALLLFRDGLKLLGLSYS